jgi:hypothetical protein
VLIIAVRSAIRRASSRTRSVHNRSEPLSGAGLIRGSLQLNQPWVKGKIQVTES